MVSPCAKVSPSVGKRKSTGSHVAPVEAAEAEVETETETEAEAEAEAEAAVISRLGIMKLKRRLRAAAAIGKTSRRGVGLGSLPITHCAKSHQCTRRLRLRSRSVASSRGRMGRVDLSSRLKQWGYVASNTMRHESGTYLA